MPNPHLQGALAPIQQEYTLTELDLSGTIPDRLDGRYLRNGPNPIGETEKRVVLYDLPVTLDPRQAAEMSAPRGLRLPTRLLLSALIGRVRIPDPATARLPIPPASDRRLPYRRNPKYPARVGVMPRDSGNADVRWFDVGPCDVFHPMNADWASGTASATRRPSASAPRSRRPDDGHRRQHPPAAPRTSGVPRQLGAGRVVTVKRTEGL